MPMEEGGMGPTSPAAGRRRWTTDELVSSHVTPVHEQVGSEVFQVMRGAWGILVMKEVREVVSCVRSASEVVVVMRRRRRKSGGGVDVILFAPPVRNGHE
ncbi:hypothetical protein Tco_0100267 [Tanacetum coccineum]